MKYISDVRLRTMAVAEPPAALFSKPYDPVGNPALFGYDVETIRRDFPILSRTVRGKPLTYLDNGASAQKPKVVTDARHPCLC